jgi:NADH oxidase (H2O2-forming)
MAKAKKLVVVGCSGCGALAGITARKLDPELDVTILREKEEPGLLTRCATPYICCGNTLVNPSYKDDRIFTDVGIKLVDHRAVAIDRKARSVTTDDGSAFPYDKLVLATGASPITPPIPGIDLPGVFTLRTSGDAVDILSWINTRRVTRAVLVGAGAIGIEEAYLLSRQGVEVTVVEMLGQLMPRSLDPDMSALVETDMQERGLQLKLNRKVTAMEGSTGVERVKLDSGEVVPADVAIVSAGVRCNTELAEQAGLELGERGLKVNEYLQTSDPDIYAGGDLIEYPSHLTGQPMLGQLRPNAVIAGRLIAWNILGAEGKYPPFINSLCTKFYDKSIAAAGLTESVAGELGMRVLAQTQSSASMHSMMRERKPYTVKLVFDADTSKLIGGQIVSDSSAPIKSIDVIALAIRCGLTAADLATFRAAGQPELSPDPGKEPISLAAQSAFLQLRK